MDESLTQELKVTVTKVSKRVAANWDIIDADDVEQCLWLFIMTSPGVQDYLAKNDKKLREKALARQAESICSQERLDYDRFTGNWHYTPKEAKSLMLRMYGNSSEDYEVPQEEALDLDVALARMEKSNPRYYKVLQEFFVHGTYERYEEKDKRRLQRAIETLSNTMNLSRCNRQSEYDKEPKRV